MCNAKKETRDLVQQFLERGKGIEDGKDKILVVRFNASCIDGYYEDATQITKTGLIYFE